MASHSRITRVERQRVLQPVDSGLKLDGQVGGHGLIPATNQISGMLQRLDRGILSTAVAVIAGRRNIDLSEGAGSEEENDARKHMGRL